MNRKHLGQASQGVILISLGAFILVRGWGPGAETAAWASAVGAVAIASFFAARYLWKRRRESIHD
jgi:hypothetical protein